MNDQSVDPANGYERIADEYMAVRDPATGVAAVRRWASALPQGAAVLDLGCGNGVPITRTLIDEGLGSVWPRCIAQYDRRICGTLSGLSF